MDEEQQPSARDRKTQSRKEKREHRGSRAFIHAMTSSRVKRTEEIIDRSDQRNRKNPGDAQDPAGN
jgi:hypothetical protein